MKKTGTRKQITNRVISLFLCAVFLFLEMWMFSANSQVLAVEFSNGKSSYGNSYSTTTIYKWKRVWERSDINNNLNGHWGRFLWVWWDGGNSTTRVTYRDCGTDATVTGRCVDSYPSIYRDRGANFDADSFYTVADLDSWSLYRFDDDDYGISQGSDRWYMDDDGAYWQVTDTVTDWDIIGDTWGGESGYRKNVGDGYVGVYYDDTGFACKDTVIQTRNNGASFYGNNTSSYGMHNFKMYMRISVSIPCISGNMTIASGNTYHLDSNIYVCSGASIRIEPGAILSIEGMCFMNGRLDNNGTVVIQSGGVMQPFVPTNNSSGKVENFGSGWYLYSNSLRKNVDCMGDLIVKKGALMITQYGSHSEGTLHMKAGGTAEIFGTVVCGRLVMDKSSRLTVRESGVLWAGYGLKGGNTLSSADVNIEDYLTTNGLSYGAEVSGGNQILEVLGKMYLYKGWKDSKPETITGPSNIVYKR